MGFGSQEFYISNATYALHVQFVDANTVTPESASPAASVAGVVPNLSRVTYPNLWNGITLTYDTADNGLARSSYRIEPGADVNTIRLRYNAPVTLNADGTLTTRFVTGALTESAPIAWQDINGQRSAVTVAFETRDDTVGFRVGAYDPAYPLFIDPTLSWHTFLGASNVADQALGVTADGNGNVYVTGSSNSAWGCSPTSCTVRNFTPFGSTSDAFVAKLDAGGNLIWNTFLGSTGYDIGYAIAIDSSGNLYVAGYSSATWGSPIRTFGGAQEGFAAKLASDGTLTWNTFLGGTGNDRAYGIAADGSGNAYVVGYSTAAWTCTLTDCTKRAYSGSGQDGFAAKVGSDGSLTWNTFLGGTGSDWSQAIAVDGSGNTYVTGYSQATWGSPKRTFTTGQDAYAAKLLSDGTLSWNTFLGGSGVDYGYGIAIDGSSNVYVTGQAQATWGTPKRTFTVSGANGDVFVAKLASDGTLTWNTFLGGTGNETGYGLAVDGSGNAYVTGYSNATWGSPVRAYTGDYDVMVAKVNSGGDLMWNTFLGGSGTDYGKAITVDASKNVNVVGYSNAVWGSPVRAFTGGAGYDEAFVAAFDRTCSPQVDGNWSASATWDCGAIPGTGDSVYIGSGKTVTLDTNTADLKHLTLGGALQNDSSAHTLSLTGNWSNSGTFTSGSYIGVTFDGTITQTLTGNTTFNNLTTNSGTILDVGSYIATVNGTLTNNGVVKRSTPTLDAQNGSPVTFGDGRGLDTAVLTSTGTNPLGTTSLVVKMHQAPGSCGSQRFTGNMVLRTFDLTPATTTNVAATVRLYFDPATELNGLNPGTLHIYHCTGTAWQELTGTYAHGTAGSYDYVELPGVTSFSPFVIGPPNAPTPVMLNTFSSKFNAVKPRVNLKWTTANELNVVGFNVWRTQGKAEWKQLNQTQIAAKHAGQLVGDKYTKGDKTAKSGKTYHYKLEIVFADGHTEWSDVKRVNVR